MKSTGLAVMVSMALLLNMSLVHSKHGSSVLELLERKHQQHRRIHTSSFESPVEAGQVLKRNGQCQFPSNAGLVAVTPGASNAGWAMSPDQPCTPGKYCPYACPPGQVMAQWDPSATAYTYPESMNGGLLCDNSGNMQKPFPSKPYCVDGTGAISAVNQCSGGSVAFCQTVLPGNEAMLIPTNVESTAVLAVPDPSYWAGTAAHYYVNPPGVSVSDACVWGTSAQSIGNWSPYVAGANTDTTGRTFVKIAWNPEYIDPSTPFHNKMPNFGIKIECDGGGCNGLPCAIDPSVNKVNQISSSTTGVGGANFCVVTVPKGSKANIIVFDGSGGSGNNGNPSSTPASSQSSSSQFSYWKPSSSSTSSSCSSSMSPTWIPDAYNTTTTPKPTLSPHIFIENMTAPLESSSASTTSVIEPTSTASVTASTTTAKSAATMTEFSIYHFIITALCIVMILI